MVIFYSEFIYDTVDPRRGTVLKIHFQKIDFFCIILAHFLMKPMDLETPYLANIVSICFKVPYCTYGAFMHTHLQYLYVQLQYLHVHLQSTVPSCAYTCVSYTLAWMFYTVFQVKKFISDKYVSSSMHSTNTVLQWSSRWSNTVLLCYIEGLNIIKIAFLRKRSDSSMLHKMPCILSR